MDVCNWLHTYYITSSSINFVAEIVKTIIDSPYNTSLLAISYKIIPIHKMKAALIR